MPAVDRYPNTSGANGSARRVLEVTPHATDELTYVAAGFLCTVPGNVSIIAQDDTAPITIPVLAGIVYPIRIKAVRVAGTTATIVALVN